ncbi:PspC domain-containing protein [Streptosporangium sp. NPDC051023]|uniref:PspC domain-containing protein n=1 Tax=Streptosporangium sp. NPDC051023 TaxID=3155410 RepID=UPI00344E0BF0
MNENDFSGVRQLRRTKDGRIIAGVAAGLGRYVGVDPNIIRAALAVTTLFGGLGVGIYAIGWLLLPEEGKNTSILQDLVSRNKDNPVWLDAKAKAEQGWAKAEQSWSRSTSQRDPHYPAPQHPAHQEPAPQYPTHQDPVQQYPAPTAPRNPDGTTPQV